MSSPIDDLFFEIFGFRPKKEGEAYEMLASAVMKLLYEKENVFHDQNIRGAISQTIYQIDVLRRSSDEHIAGEAKDYSCSGSKVGRPDLQKLAGAIIELPVSEAIFLSATDYTAPAQKYAQASNSMLGKPISLFHLRPSTSVDEEGRIKTIVISFHIFLPVYENAAFSPQITQPMQAKLAKKVEAGELQAGKNELILEKIYDKNGTVLTTVAELTSRQFSSNFSEIAEGSFYLPGGHIKLGDDLIEIHGITFKIPFSEEVQTIEVSSNGEAKLLIKSVDKGIDKLISEGDLRKIKFGSDGSISM